MEMPERNRERGIEEGKRGREGGREGREMKKGEKGWKRMSG